ncbi:hypothetical protein FB45DRAFT_1059130 [Roridomyces roridus]|uniref:Mitochondrial splicing suppressor 51-like C-terminal domain-containing protein n=1 Tax=Roridomyces roridus TaxID=1738132 RepID=A0AAD7FJL1_9AGAR|nr:hypothetical protein FB45DRAFT_1059130 [Roridomyces roridus]
MNRALRSPAFEESWASYYQWRGIPIESPAALLLHWPLPVYACLKALGFTLVPEAGMRRKLTVVYAGVREEIAFIPIFGELALLFPNTDLDLVMYGPSAETAVKKAIKDGLLRRVAVAPSAIILDSTSEYYRPSRQTSEHPDAIVALNAGLAAFRAWRHVIYLAAEFAIPFAITDFSEGGAFEVPLGLMEQALSSSVPPRKADEKNDYMSMKKVAQEVGLQDVEGAYTVLRQAQNRLGKLNEFMHPLSGLCRSLFALGPRTRSFG